MIVTEQIIVLTATLHKQPAMIPAIQNNVVDSTICKYIQE